MRFFEPRDSFWKFAEHFESCRILDVGCGDGDLVREMRARGMEAYGVDPRFVLFDLEVPEDLEGVVIPLEVTSVPDLVRACSVVLCCRPCHSGFPADAIKLVGAGAQFYYVGFEKNLDNDVDLEENTATLLLQDVGMDEEDLWLIERNHESKIHL